jgi:hypothetical protein
MSRLDRLRGRYRVQAEPLKTERRIELLLLCLVVLVVVQLFWMALRTVMPGFMGIVPPATDSLMVQEGGHTGSVTAQDSLLLQSRPLFWGSRRPIEPSPAQLAEDLLSRQRGRVIGALKNLGVSGVYGAGETGGAIVTYKGDQRRIAVGDELDGWTLVRVGHGEAVWASGLDEDVRRLLPLPVLAGVGAAAEAPSAPISTPIEEATDQATNDALPTGKKPSKNRVKRSLSSGGPSPGPSETRRKREK